MGKIENWKYFNLDYYLKIWQETKKKLVLNSEDEDHAEIIFIFKIHTVSQHAEKRLESTFEACLCLQLRK